MIHRTLHFPMANGAAHNSSACARRLVLLLAEDGPGALQIAASSLRPADLAAAIEAMEVADREKIFVALPADIAAEVLEEVGPDLRDELLELSDDQRMLHILAEAPADDAVYFLDHLDEARAERLLAQMDAKLREDLEEQYELPENSVGRIMQRNLVTLRSFLTAAQAIAYIQQSHKDDAPIAPRSLYVIDAEGRTVGVMGFRELLFAQPKAVLSTIMEREPIHIAPEADREEAARLMQKYDLMSLPVVDKHGHIKGVVTVDDIVDVVQQAATEDMQKMGGVESLGAPYLLVPVIDMVRKRGGWLALLFVGQLLTATVMGHFESELAANLALAIFIPLIISSGGNSGSQATSLVIRSLVLGELRLRDWGRVLARELASGAILGLVLGLMGFLRVLIWHWLWPESGSAYGEQFLIIGLTVACSLVGIVLWGSISGAMLPFLLHRLKFDPASASAPLVATLVDVTGLLIYFTTAKLVFTLAQ